VHWLTISPESNLGRAHCYPSWQRMDLPATCATSYTIPTADKCSHSATGTLHPLGNSTCILYV